MATMESQIILITDWLGTGALDLFGRPFAGKDTQADLLAELFHGVVIGGGDILRSQPIPPEIQKDMDSGTLIPTNYYLSVMVPYLSQPSLAGTPLLFSSVGRWHGEEPGIIEGAEQSGHPLKAVINLELSADAVRQRYEESKLLQDRGERADDSPEVIENRLAEYQNKTEPVLQFYRDKGLLIEVDGTKSREVVTQEILDSLARLATN